ncbi:MAG: LL-diaminopimelate aminotransferase [Lachnospiraceae bacterium]|nr:LL-diaminopimelate aminotransferase [Lachnospiraceae bacterium]
MVKVNENYLKLEKNYLFINIAKKVNAYKEAHPEADIIRMGIGDVTLPICKAAVDAMKKGADEMGVKETFKGYEDSGAGYDFLRDAVSGYYKSFGVDVPADDIRINDGAKSDCGNIVDIFGDDNTILITDPAYPVYVDSNRMNGRKVIFADSNEENGFAAMPDESVKADIIYLCSPNNPTGSVYTKEQLKAWVDYANKNGSVILYDAAYEAYISEEDVPHSIYECEGAESCAIEIRSFSKNAGFTGLRLGYTVIPKALEADGVKLHALWARRHGTKYNGAPYIIQRAGEAVYSPAGKEQLKAQVAYYMKNAAYIREGLTEAGYTVSGGINAPYIWLETPEGMSSWEFFDLLLEKAGVVGTPGSGFGPSGEHYFRLTAFGSFENTVEAIKRIKEM